jgi:putative transcriptional regulator
MKRMRHFAAFVIGSTLALVAAAPLAVRADRPANAKPARGTFLIASPRMLDPNFAKTVVLLTRYGPDGTMGVVVNRPTDVAIGHVVPRFSDLARSNEKIFVGGPVRRNGLYMLVRTKEKPKDSQHVFDDVYLSGSQDVLKGVIGDGKSGANFRVYVGHAGWGPGQLDAELARGDWLVTPADADSLFVDVERLWRNLQPPDPTWTAELHQAAAHQARRVHVFRRHSMLGVDGRAVAGRCVWVAHRS